MSEIKFRAIKFFNLLGYFRNHFSELAVGTFYIKHPNHFSDHDGFFEKVSLVDYDKKSKEITVKRLNHRGGEKSFIRKVHISQIYLNAR